MKKFKWILWLIVFAAAGVAIWAWKFREEETVILLQTENPKIGSLTNAVTATGTVQPVDTVAVGSQVSGTIKTVYVDFNSAVKKGQLLAQIDPSLMQAQVQQISANLQSSQANVVYQKSNYDRQTQLYNVGAISKAELETALYSYSSAKDNVSSISAQLKSAQQNLSFTNIYSPIDGTVLSRSVSEGQTVAASFSTPELFSIAKDLTKMQVQASVDEADIGNVKQGQRVSFTVDAFPKDTFSGTVKEIRLRSSVSSNVVTYTTIIDAPNNDMKLKPGMTANISIYTKEINNIMLVSASALNFKPDSALAKKYTIEGMPGPNGNKPPEGMKPNDGNSSMPPPPNDDVQNDSVQHAFVWVKKDSSIMLKPITIGLDDETQVQVLSGLQEGDVVVTGYTQKTKEESKKTEASSPFMPKPPGGNSKNKNNNPGPPPGQ